MIVVDEKEVGGCTMQRCCTKAFVTNVDCEARPKAKQTLNVILKKYSLGDNFECDYNMASNCEGNARTAPLHSNMPQIDS